MLRFQSCIERIKRSTKKSSLYQKGGGRLRLGGHVFYSFCSIKRIERLFPFPLRAILMRDIDKQITVLNAGFDL